MEKQQLNQSCGAAPAAQVSSYASEQCRDGVNVLTLDRCGIARGDIPAKPHVSHFRWFSFSRKPTTCLRRTTESENHASRAKSWACLPRSS